MQSSDGTFPNLGEVLIKPHVKLRVCDVLLEKANDVMIQLFLQCENVMRLAVVEYMVLCFHKKATI
jgi:hypothetical protein